MLKMKCHILVKGHVLKWLIFYSMFNRDIDNILVCFITEVTSSFRHILARDVSRVGVYKEG